MNKLIPFYLFFIGLMLTVKRLNRYHFATMIAVILWSRIEAMCVIKPTRDVVLLVGVVLILIPTLISNNIFGRIIKYIWTAFLALVCIYLSVMLEYYSNFGTFGLEEMQALMQTDFKEATSNASHFISFTVILWLLLISSIIFIPFLIPNKYVEIIKQREAKIPYLRYVLMLLIAIPIVHLIKRYDTLELVYKPYMMYETILAEKEMTARRIKPILPKSDGKRDINIILVVGETATAGHLGSYGYYRDTSPYLDKMIESDNIILFKKAYSSHSYTQYTVPYILSSANLNNPDDLVKAPTIFNVLESKGFNTWWISNQEKVALFSNIFTLMAQEAEHVTFMTNNQFEAAGYDDALLPNIKEALLAPGKKFIGTHIMGSHTTYDERYPSSFDANLGYYGKELWGNVSDDILYKVNTYDLSIAYTDKFIHDLVNMVPEDQKTILLYSSDHGEGVLTGFLHDSGKVLHHDMFHVPFFVWVNDAFKEAYPEVVSSIKSISNKYITNDRIYDLITYIEGSDVDLNSFTHNTRDGLYTRWGEVALDDLNWFAVAKDVNRLKQMSNANIILKSANSLEKVMFAKRCEYDGVEIDLVFDESSSTLRPSISMGGGENHISNQC